ncbi:hypothetical protein vseg_014384 [Gypsophila vaccaria]
MAKTMSVNPVSIFVVVVLALVAVAQAQEMAPSPAPSVGAGFSVPVSNAVVAFSIVLSLFSLLKH